MAVLGVTGSIVVVKKTAFCIYLWFYIFCKGSICTIHIYLKLCRSVDHNKCYLNFFLYVNTKELIFKLLFQQNVRHIVIIMAFKKIKTKKFLGLKPITNLWVNQLWLSKFRSRVAVYTTFHRGNKDAKYLSPQIQLFSSHIAN